MGFFNRPLAFGAHSTEEITRFQNEHALLPTQVELGDPTYPEEPGIANGPEAYESTGTRLFQYDDSMPADVGAYEIRFHSDAGLTTELNSHIVPAPGSGNMSMPRDYGGVPGVNRVIDSTGPVRGESYAAYRNVRAATVPKMVGQLGPVVGGQDYAQQLANAYYQQANAAFNQAAAESAMVSAV